MRRLLRGIDNFSDYVGRIASFAVLIATLVVVYEVGRRYLFNAPSAWGFELPIMLAGVTYYLSGGYTERFDGHVRVDLLYARWSLRTRAVVDVVMSPVYFGSIGLLGWHSWTWTLSAIDSGTRTGSSWNPLIWPMRLAIPVGCALLLIQGFAGLVRNLHIAVTGHPLEPFEPSEPVTSDGHPVNGEEPS